MRVCGVFAVAIPLKDYLYVPPPAHKRRRTAAAREPLAPTDSNANWPAVSQPSSCPSDLSATMLEPGGMSPPSTVAATPVPESAELEAEKTHALSVRGRPCGDYFGPCWFYFAGLSPERQKHLEAVVRCGGGFSVKAPGVLGVTHVVLGPTASKRDADVLVLREQRPAPVFVSPLWLIEASSAQRLAAPAPFVFAEDVVA
jgi:hypothetical protein